MAGKLPAKIKNKPAPRKTGKAVPPALKRWHETHPNSKNAHKSYGPNASRVPKKGKGK